MSKSFVFQINGMSCISCSNALEQRLRQHLSSNLEYFHTDVTTPDPKTTTIILKNHSAQDTQTKERLKTLIEQAGFHCINNTIPESQAKEPQSQSARYLNSIQKILSSHWFLGILGCGLGLALLITCLTVGSLPLIAMIPIAVFSSIFTLFLGARSYIEAWNKLIKTKTLTMDSLFALSTLSILIVSISAFFVPWLSMMFEAGLLIFGFRHIGLAIEERFKKQINAVQFKDRAPKTVRLCLENGQQEIQLSCLKAGTVIELHEGEIVPVDGCCEEDSTLYNTIVTGSIIPKHYTKGEHIVAGMRLNGSARPFRMRVERDANHSYLARLDKSIAQSLYDKAPLELKTKNLLVYFIPIVIALSILSGVLVACFFPAAIAIQCALGVLVSACPCTLGLIIPLAVKTGMHKAATHGAHFKSAKALQQMEQIDSIVFDLNGTLTTGIPTVKDYSVLPNSGITTSELLSISAALENCSTHPIGKAIYTFSKTKNIIELPVDARDEHAHHSGITGSIERHNYMIGSQALMQQYGIDTREVDAHLTPEAGDHIIYIARDQQLIGYIIVTDPLRDDAKQTIDTLTKMGVTVHLCTGAAEQTALRYAKALNIKQVYANSVATTVTPDDRSKPAYIQSLRDQKHNVAMVGDAANDANALANSDLGIAILSPNSDELTQQHAAVVIQNGTLLPIANAFAASRQTVNNIKQNLSLSLGYNVAAILFSSGLLLAVGLTLSPAVGAALMAAQAVIILLNVYYFKQRPFAHLTEVTPTTKTCSSSFHLIQQHIASIKSTAPAASAQQQLERISAPKEITSQRNSVSLLQKNQSVTITKTNEHVDNYSFQP